MDQEPEEAVVSAAESAESGDSKPLPAVGGCLLWFLCVIWPAGTILIEFTSAMCAEEFFDPIPTWVHLLLMLLVPLGGMATLVALGTRVRRQQVHVLAGLLGVGLAVSALYSLVFLPLAPMAVIAVIFAGLGLLPLTPFAAFVGTCWLTVLLFRAARGLERAVWPGLLTGATVAIAVLFTMEVSVYRTAREVRTALKGEPEQRVEAIRSLRRSADEATLLAMCNRGWKGAPSLFAGFQREGFGLVPRTELDGLYYQVTGRAPRAEDAEGWFGLRRRARQGNDWEWGDEFGRGWDAGRGTRVVGSRLPGLYLSSSRLDGVVDGHTAIAYVEWTFEFQNSGNWEQEARSLLRMPVGSVVSKLSLWIDGQERDAAFGGRTQTTQAYQQVVRRRKDPALVTTHGRDTVLLQCFPVLPGELMRVLVGMTIPMRIGESDGEGTDLAFELPALVEMNFLPRGPQSVWFESRDPMSDPRAGLLAEPAPAETWVLRGELPAESVSDDSYTIHCDGPSPLPVAWANDYVQPGRTFVQRFVFETVEPPERIAVVIDGSLAMRTQRERCLELLEAIDPGLPVIVVLAGAEEVLELGGRDEAIERLRESDFAYGNDNAPALVIAWNHLYRTPGSVIYWLHGSQPVPLFNESALQQRIERQPGGPEIVSCQLVGGPHRLVEALSALPVERFSTLQAEQALARFRELHRELHHESEVIARHLEPIEEVPEGAFHGSDHLVRLWARRTVEELRSSNPKEAQEIAAQYRLVTPVSGAVVLETVEQYEAADLAAEAPPSSVPTVPEPGFWLLVAVAVAVLALLGRRRARGALR